ncbi:MAG: hypothetical protein ACRDWN_10400, partial [Acidimicrobiales bacterium]
MAALLAVRKVPAADRHYLLEHGAEVLAARREAPAQWQRWWWVCVGGEVVFLPTISLLAGRWRPSRARRDADAHRRRVDEELARLGGAPADEGVPVLSRPGQWCSAGKGQRRGASSGRVRRQCHRPRKSGPSSALESTLPALVGTLPRNELLLAIHALDADDPMALALGCEERCPAPLVRRRCDRSPSTSTDPVARRGDGQGDWRVRGRHGVVTRAGSTARGVVGLSPGRPDPTLAAGGRIHPSGGRANGGMPRSIGPVDSAHRWCATRAKPKKKEESGHA